MKFKNTKMFYLLFIAVILICLFSLTPAGQNFILMLAESALGRSLAKPEKWIRLIKTYAIFFITFSSTIIVSIRLKPFYFPKDGESTCAETKLTKMEILYFFLTSALILTLCSTTSPIYAFHAWDDSNCFFTVGKSVLHGKTIYKDIYEQKGPLLYFMHTAAYLISRDSFLGIWIFQIVSATTFLIFSYKSISLFVSREVRENLKFYLPIVLAIIFSSTCFVVGDSVEEFSMALTMYPLFVSLKNLKAKTEFKNKELFFSGVCAGCVFWMKFSLVGFFIGWAIVPIWFYLKQRNFRGIFKAVGFVWGGVAAVSLPILIYFFVNDAIADLFQVYFLDNIFLYAVSGNRNPVLRSIIFCFKGFESAYTSNLFIFILLVISAVAILKSKILSFIKIHIFLCYFFSLFFIYCGGRSYKYYSLLLSVFCIFSILLFPLLKLRRMTNGRQELLKIFFSVILAAFIIFCTSSNVSLLRLKKSDYPQFQFAKVINEKENATLLNYGFLDGGFYTVAKIVPNCKYFTGLNIPNPKIMEEQNRFVEETLVDFVITCDQKLASENYELVQSVRSEIRKSSGEYFLYQRKNSCDFEY